ncbi:MAG: dTDP-4-dehydrorhamnose 3,5-epimerase family protein [Nanoarchaeota archaeon]
MTNATNHIEGVIVTPMNRISDERGVIYHMMRNDDPYFKQFGETYGSWVHPGAIKAWHVHKEMTLNYVVPVGKIKLVVCDLREGSPTKGKIMEFFMSKDNYIRVSVPPGVANGFKGIGTEDSLVINIPTHPYTPGEMIRIDPFSKEINYDWNIKHG